MWQNDHQQPLNDNFLTLDGEVPQPEGKLKHFFKQLGHGLWEIIKIFALAILLYFLIDAAIGRDKVQNISMKPTLQPGDMMLVDKIIYRFNSPKFQEIIVFKNPQNLAEGYVKRIIGVPGDVIEVKEGQLFRNGNLIKEPYVRAPMFYSGRWDVPANKVFVLGDNRNQSFDSHSWGMLDQDLIIGKVFFVYWPFAHIQTIEDLNSGMQPLEQ